MTKNNEVLYKRTCSLEGFSIPDVVSIRSTRHPLFSSSSSLSAISISTASPIYKQYELFFSSLLAY